MELYLLLIPYIFLIPINGVRLFLIQQLLDQLIVDLPRAQVHRLHRLKAINVQWYIWLVRRSIKDWAIAGVLGGVTVKLLADSQDWLLPAGLAVLGLVLLVNACLAVVILLYSAGYRVPGVLLITAVRLSIPDLVPANRKRAGSWGAALVSTGAVGLAAWFYSGNSGSLLWSFVTLALGLFSVLWALFPDPCDTSEVMIDVKNLG